MAENSKIDLVEFAAGMAAARQVPDVAMQATVAETMAAGGPDFTDAGSRSLSWHAGYDEAIRRARKSCRPNQMPRVPHG